MNTFPPVSLILHIEYITILFLRLIRIISVESLFKYCKTSYFPCSEKLFSPALPSEVIYSSSSSIGTATLVGYDLLNYRWVFSAGRFIQSAIASGTSNTQLGAPVIRTFQLPSPGVPLVLSPCDFDLIPKMKEPLRGIRFRTVPEILQAVDCSIRTINTTGAAEGILRLPHRL